MNHDVVDLNHWKSVFPLDRLRAEAPAAARARIGESAWLGADDETLANVTLSCEPIVGRGVLSSPYHLAVIEQVREEAFRSVLPGRTLPTDVFVFELGESARRDVTKTGGLPYWPAEEPWPKVDDDQTIFLGQLSFVDSGDLFDDLPGDILLVFAHPAWHAADDEEWDGWRPELVFAWQRIESRPLIAEANIPPVRGRVRACCGVIHRTADYPDVANVLNGFPRWQNSAIVSGTKIGGSPASGHWPYYSNSRYLGSIGSVDPVFGRPWPFLNVEAPITTIRESMRLQDRLILGDLGRLDLYLDVEHVRYRVED